MLCLTISAFAQEESYTNRDPNQESTKNVRLITFNGLTPFAFDTPRYRLGYTHGFSEHIHAEVQVGYGSENTTFNITNSASFVGDSYSLFEILPQITYIFNPAEKLNYYLAIQGVYLNHKNRYFNENYFDRDLGVNISYDEAEYDREKIGVNVLTGFYTPLGDSPFGIDIFIGFGVRSRTNTYSNLVNPIANLFFDDERIFLPGYRDISGTTIGLNFSLGFKFTFNLNN
jgi:hypothetical protein